MIAAIIVVIIGLSCLVLVVQYIGPRMILMPDRRGPEFYQKRYGFSHPLDVGLKYQDGTLTTEDGLKLRYWVIDPAGCDRPKGTVIFFHGITDSKVSGLGYARELTRLCQKVYLLDMRSHGESDGKYCTYGFFEKKDVSKLIDQIKSSDPDSKIALLGVSMGAAISIQAAAGDSRVDRVIAVAPFYDLFSIALDHQARKIGLKSRLLLRLVIHRAEKIAGFKSSEVSPAKDIGRIHVPVMIVHGEKDRTVKKEYSTLLQNLNHGVRLLMIEGAGHVDVLEKGGSEYVQKLAEFLSS